MILFRCSTYYQLFNAINYKWSYYPNEDADLLLSDATDFEYYYEKIKESGIFRNVYLLTDRQRSLDYSAYPRSKRKRINRRPKKFLNLGKLKSRYSVLCIFVDEPYNYLLFKYLAARNRKLKIHIIEEGLSTYVLDIQKRFRSYGITESLFKQKRILNHIEKVVLYDPELYRGGFPVQIAALPKIDAMDTESVKRLQSIFEINPVPEEKFIFFEEGFFRDKRVTTDFEVIDRIADTVGKENIIIKLHPRNEEDRFTPRGYKIFPYNRSPWEMSLLLNPMKDKVFLSFSSTACLAPGIVFNCSMTSLLLYRVLLIGENLPIRQAAFHSYLGALMVKYNEKEKQIFCPRSFDELDEVLSFIMDKDMVNNG